jgi:DNA phosphorothioation system restriction enzyme
MASLRSLQLNLSYRSNRDDLVRHFFVPCLHEASLYRRAAGYFTSSGLSVAARGVASLAARGGRMQLVVSPYLEQEDVDALRAAAQNPANVLRAVVARSLGAIEDALMHERLAALSWLAASKLLDLKLAFRMDSFGSHARGLFHEKIGVFTDAENNHVSFCGSANETAGGLVENFESLKVFCSWRDAEGRVDEDIADFGKLWANDTPGLSVLDFTEASAELLERYRAAVWEQSPENASARLLRNSPRPSSPAVMLRSYQEDAIRAWTAANGRGVFAMATGSGKTLTALFLAQRVAKRTKPLMVIVTCPFLNLCNQWIREMERFGLTAIPCFDDQSRWRPQLAHAYQRLLTRVSDCETVVVSNATYVDEAFQSQLRARAAGGLIRHLLIADEVHNLGSSCGSDALVNDVTLRLGLSATPERYLDPIGTEAVLSYFGGVVFEYNLAQAIDEGRLCGYRYYPIVVHFDDDEAEQYAQISTQLSRFFGRSGDDDELPHGAMHLLIKRSRLIAGARRKIQALRGALKSLPQLPSRALFYCGDGTTSQSATAEDVRQIEAVSKVLADDFGLKVRHFTYRESAAEREQILADLATNALDGVVAIRCLDEGIDLPDLQYGFLLASSTNPRQFIQRRGRLLRNSPGKSHAVIYDFLMHPPALDGASEDAAFNMERRFLKRELRRIDDFCSTAINGPEARATLLPLKHKYNLLAGS